MTETEAMRFEPEWVDDILARGVQPNSTASS